MLPYPCEEYATFPTQLCTLHTVAAESFDAQTKLLTLSRDYFNRANGGGAAAGRGVAVHSAHPVFETLQGAAILQSQPARALVLVH